MEMISSDKYEKGIIKKIKNALFQLSFFMANC